MENREARRIKPRLNICDTQGFSIVDISETGVSVRATKEYKKGQSFVLSLALPELSSSISCRVVRCDASRSMFDTGFAIGARFVDCTVCEQLAIRHFIDTFIAEEKAQQAASKLQLSKGKAEGRITRRAKVKPYVIQTSGYKAVDLSETGIQLMSDHPHDRGDRIDLRLMLNSVALEVVGEVMWSRSGCSFYTSDYVIGVRFSDLSVISQLNIRRYIAGLSSE